MKITTFCIYRKQILLVFNTFCMFMWSTCTLRIRHVVVSHMCRIWYQHDMIRYIWLHWIMLFSQIIIGVDMSMLCMMSVYSMWKIFVLFVFLAFAVFTEESFNKLWGLVSGISVVEWRQNVTSSSMLLTMTDNSDDMHFIT